MGANQVQRFGISLAQAGTLARAQRGHVEVQQLPLVCDHGPLEPRAGGMAGGDEDLSTDPARVLVAHGQDLDRRRPGSLEQLRRHVGVEADGQGLAGPRQRVLDEDPGPGDPGGGEARLAQRIGDGGTPSLVGGRSTHRMTLFDAAVSAQLARRDPDRGRGAAQRPASGAGSRLPTTSGSLRPYRRALWSPRLTTG